MTKTRFEIGLENLNRVECTEKPSIIEALETVAPELGQYIIEFGYGEIYARSGLSFQHRQLATIAILTALGTAPTQLRFHIRGALNVGCTLAEIIESQIQLLPFCGFPAVLNGITVVKETLFDESDGILKITPNSIHTKEKPRDRYKEGLEAFMRIDGEAGLKITENLKDISPDLVKFIIEFVFGDIYIRPGLDLVTREIITVSALTAIGYASPQLKVHIHGFLNVGGSQKQLLETIIHTSIYAGFPAAINAAMMMKEVISERSDSGESAQA